MKTVRIHSPRREERGSALLITMIMTIMLMGLAASIVSLAQVNSREADLLYDTTALFIGAESGLALAEVQINQALANWETPPASLAMDLDGVTVQVACDHVQGLDHTVTDEDGIVTSIQVWKLIASAAKPIPGTGESYTTTVHKVLLVNITPLFQFVVFYDGDLEINNGPPMTLTGRVHTNSDMYLSPNNSLTMDSNYVRAVGNMYRSRKDDWGASNGSVNIRNSQTGNYVRMDNQSQFNPPNGSESGFDSNYQGYDANGDGDFDDAGEMLNWTTGALDNWGGTVRTSVHDANVWEAPESQTIQPLVERAGGAYDADGHYVGPGGGTHERSFYNETAQLRIVDDRAYAADGTDITDQLPSGAITEKTIFDGREEKTITVTEVDMELLSQSDHWPANGLVYAQRTDMTRQSEVGSSYQPNGIKLVHGEQLRGPMTFVSESPVYVQGDFNTGVTPGEFGDEYDGAYGKQPASVICDAINLLSNAWDDSKQNGQLPSATDTTYNCAFITGNHDTTFDGDYNGGFENLPRFHENWSGRTAQIRGSFVNLWRSTVGTGRWSYGGDNYTAPNRDWDFDTDFFDADNLPPFTPRAVGTGESIQWEEP